MWESINDFAKIRQGKYQSVPKYYERFCAMRDVKNSLGCSIYSHLGLTKVIAREKGENASTISTAKKNTYMKIGKDHMMAMHFLMGADKIKYDDTITSYKNMYLMNKRNNYPATLHYAFVLMKGWTTTSTNHIIRLGLHSTPWDMMVTTPMGRSASPRVRDGIGNSWIGNSGIGNV